MKISELAAFLLQTFGHLTDAQLLALAIYGEARGETREGRIAVGSVILERRDAGGWFGEGIKGVILKPYQFSCFLPGDPNFTTLRQIAENWQTFYENSTTMQKCFGIAAGLIGGGVPRDPVIATAHCKHYCTIDAKPSWKAKMRLVGTVNRHEFYA